MKSYPTHNDIEKCEDEPIAFYPKIQRHGCLLVLDNKFTIKQVSNNTNEIINIDYKKLLEKNLDTIFNNADFETLTDWYNSNNDNNSFLIKLKETNYIVVAHKNVTGVLLDIEPEKDAAEDEIFRQSLLQTFKLFSSTKQIQELLHVASIQIKKLFGYDRVMIYKFDENWNGQIVSEAREENLESWLGLSYPASDIPKNARHLFQSQGVRSLSNISETYAEIVPTLYPETQELTDIGKSDLRGSSPFHIEYLKNMGVEATLNCAIIHNNKLWGLIACHHYSPKITGFSKKQSCHLLTEMFSSQISLKVSDKTFENIERSSSVRNQLIENISVSGDVINGLVNRKVTGKNLLNCSDFIVGFNDEIQSVSNVLTNEEITHLVVELFNKYPNKDYIYNTSIATVCPWLKNKALNVSGVLLYKLSHQHTKDFVIWLKPEKLKNVTWGGNPNTQKIQQEQNFRLSPRKSFEKWSELVKNTSEPWTKNELSVTKTFVADVKNIIVTKFTEVNHLNKQLTNLNEELESFSYSVSHDLRGPIRGIDGFAQILIEDYADVLDDYGKESLNVIVNSCAKMNELMDDILGYSGLSKVGRIDINIDVIELCNTIINDNNLKSQYPNSEIVIQKDIPDIFGDRSMIYQLFTNLITNACKYSSKVANPKIEIGFEPNLTNNIYFVKDNGIGFKADYAKKIFGVFTRLVQDEYQGTGVGLAIAQRVMFKHNGQIWAESELGKGAAFKFRFGV